MTTPYDRIGEQYRKFKETAALPIPEGRLFTTMLGDMTGLRALDLACGYGHYTRRLHSLGASRAVGIDISPVMVVLAATQTPPELTGVTFLRHDATDLPSIDRFDVVTAVWLLNYADSEDDLRAMLAGARRNLRPGGCLKAITVHPEFDPHLADWEPYGLRVDELVRRPHRHWMRVELLGPETAIPLEISRWDREVYTEAAHAAGFDTVTWHLPTISPADHARRPPGFWDAYLANPYVVGFHAQ